MNADDLRWTLADDPVATAARVAIDEQIARFMERLAALNEDRARALAVEHFGSVERGTHMGQTFPGRYVWGIEENVYVSLTDPWTNRTTTLEGDTE